VITNPTNRLGGGGQGRDFLYLMEQVKKLGTQTGLNSQAIENILNRLSGHESSFETEDLAALNGIFNHIITGKLSLSKQLIQRITEPGDYVVAYLGDGSFTNTHGPVPVEGMLNTTKDTQIAPEGTPVPVSGTVLPMAPVSVTGGAPAISFLHCNVANKSFDVLVMWTKNSCIALYSQDDSMPIDKVGVISRTTGNAPGDPSRLVLGITNTAFNDTFEVQLYAQHINATNNTISYREPVNTSVDGHALFKHTHGFSIANLIISELDVTRLGVDSLTARTLTVTDTSNVPTAPLRDSTNTIANTEFVTRIEDRLDQVDADFETRITDNRNDIDAMPESLVSDIPNNALLVDSTGKLFVSETGLNVPNLISEDPDNSLEIGTDNLLHVDFTPVREEIVEAITTEAQNRQAQVDELNNEIISTNKVLSGAHTVTYKGVFQGNIGDPEILDASLIPGQTAVIAPGKAIFFDIEGSVATYIGDMGIVNELPEIWVIIKSKALNDTIIDALDTKIEGQNIVKYVSTTEATYNALKELGQLETSTVYQYESVIEPTATLIGRWTTPYNQVINNWDGSVIQTNIPFVDATELNFIISAMQGSTSGTNGPNNTIEPVIIDLAGAVVYRIISSPPYSPGTLKALARVRSQVSHEGGQKAVFVNSVADQIVGSAHYWIDENANRITGFNNWSNDPFIYGGIAANPSILPGGAELFWGFAQSADANGPPDGTFNYLLKVERMEMTESL